MYVDKIYAFWLCKINLCVADITENEYINRKLANQLIRYAMNVHEILNVVEVQDIQPAQFVLMTVLTRVGQRKTGRSPLHSTQLLPKYKKGLLLIKRP